MFQGGVFEINVNLSTSSVYKPALYESQINFRVKFQINSISFLFLWKDKIIEGFWVHVLKSCMLFFIFHLLVCLHFIFLSNMISLRIQILILLLRRIDML